MNQVHIILLLAAVNKQQTVSRTGAGRNFGVANSEETAADSGMVTIDSLLYRNVLSSDTIADVIGRTI